MVELVSNTPSGSATTEPKSKAADIVKLNSRLYFISLTSH